MRSRPLVASTESGNARRALVAAARCLSSCSVLACAAAACSAGGNENQGLLPTQPDSSSAGGSGPSVGGGTGDPNPPLGTGETPGFDLGDDVGDSVAGPGCQQAERKFDPKIPTVFMLVDRSATMFDVIGDDNLTAWTGLRGGALQVMSELQSSVRFGFGAFVGDELPDQACTFDFQSVPPALDNYAAIAALYQPLDRPSNGELKETPALPALNAAADQLRADPQDGDKYILFVTDGEPDYCDNGPLACPADSVIALLQRLSSSVDAAGQPQVPVRTLILGLSSPSQPARAEVLQGFANAGAGLPVAPLPIDPNQPYDPNGLYYNCNMRPGWRDEVLAAGGSLVQAQGQTVATYATDPTLAGTAPVYRPDPTDQAALIEEVRAALAGVKSCTFDLAEDGVKVDLARADLGERARVIVNGNPVPLDQTNGWHMLSETTVQLEGTACNDWRDPTIETTISFDFPCEIFIPQ